MGKGKDRRYVVVVGDEEKNEQYENVRIKYGHGYVKIYQDDGTRIITNKPYIATQLVVEEEEEEKE